MEESKKKNIRIRLSILEASDRLGGVIGTHRQDGCLLEQGPDAIFTEKPWGVDFCRLVGLEKELIPTHPEFRRSFIAIHGKLRPVPEGFYILAPSKIGSFLASPIFSIQGKIRALAEIAVAKRKGSNDESLGSFVSRRFGREILERIAQPMAGGIYSSNPWNLSLKATFPRFLKMEEDYGSVIRALTAKGKEKETEASGPRYSLFVSLSGGLDRLVQKTQEFLPPDAVELKKRADQVVKSEKGYKISGKSFETEADAVCVALPGPQCVALLKKIDADLSGVFSDIPYRSGATVNFIYRRSDVRHPLDGFGFVVPEIEKKFVTGCTFSSVKFPGRSPEDKVVLRAFAGGKVLEQTTTEREIEQKSRKDLEDYLGIQAPPVFAIVRKHLFSMPEYQVGHLGRVRAIKGRLSRMPGLAIAGNALDGIGIPDCVHSGQEAAEKILKDMGA